MDLFANLFSSTAQRRDKRDVVILIGNSRFDVEVIGEKNYQAAWEAICSPRVSRVINRYETAWLILEDEKKVRVEIRGRQVGYLRTAAAIQYRKELRAKAMPSADGQGQAVIRSGWISSDRRKRLYCVSLDIPSLSFP